MEIPTLPEEERQRIFTQMWVGQMYGAIGFIMQKLGPQALEEYNEGVAKQSAEQFKAMGWDNPMGFAMAQAVTCKNVFGSEVEVLPSEDGSVTLDIKRCANLEAALEFAQKGGPITREQHCGGCINGYFKPVAEKLGLRLQAGFTDKGCKMTIRK